MKARSTVRDIDPQNDLTFLRVRSKKNEIMIAPGEEGAKVFLKLNWQRLLKRTLRRGYVYMHLTESAFFTSWIMQHM